MNRSLLQREILPQAALFAALVAATVLADALLHRLQLAWIGRYLGIPGSLMILAAMAYSLRKRRIIARGDPATLLGLHKALAWTGSLLVLVHAGAHFHAILPWLALAAMIANVVSGLTGAYLLGRARRHVDARRQRLLDSGLGAQETEARLFWDALTLDLLARWRVVHLPIAAAFAMLALAHIVSLFALWGWR